MPIAFFCGSVYYVSDLIDIMYIDTDRKFPNNYGLFMGLCWWVTCVVTFQNIMLLQTGRIEYERRRYLLKELTNALYFNFDEKDESSLKYPTINFFDTQSLNTWLEARQITIAVGGRFTKRVHVYVALWIILNAMLLAKWMIWIGGYLPEAYAMEWKE